MGEALIDFNFNVVLVWMRDGVEFWSLTFFWDAKNQSSTTAKPTLGMLGVTGTTTSNCRLCWAVMLGGGSLSPPVFAF